MLERKVAPLKRPRGSSGGAAPRSTDTSKPSPAARAPPCSDVMSGDERWRILRLHVEHQAPLAAIARDTGIGLRTLQRWHHLYRERGITGLTHTLSLIHISEPTRLRRISYAVFCLKKKKKKNKTTKHKNKKTT